MNLLLESLKALLFGIVEGVTEWLPISSTGHMILLDEFVQLQMTDAFKSMFEVVIQLGAILAVVVLYFSKLWPFKKPKKGEGFVGLFKMETVMLWLKVVVAILPSAIVGIPFDDWMDAHLHNAPVVAAMLVIYGVAFILVEKKHHARRARIQSVELIDMRMALMIGLFQVLSLVPGTSRSGATILGGILMGCSRAAASEFSDGGREPDQGAQIRPVLHERGAADSGRRLRERVCRFHHRHQDVHRLHQAAQLHRVRLVSHHPRRAGGGIFSAEIRGIRK